jgi:hypothetical protein
MDMNKAFPFIIYLLISGPLVSGQTLGGMKAGLNVSEMIITNKPDSFTDPVLKPFLGYQVGCFIQDGLSRYLDWKVEMLFSKKGFVSEADGSKKSVSLNYLTWPVFLVYEPSEKFEAEAGLELGYLITGGEGFPSFDVGLNVGILYSLFPHWSAGLRYNLGIPSKMISQKTSSETDPPKYQHSILQISIVFDLLRYRNE